MKKKPPLRTEMMCIRVTKAQKKEAVRAAKKEGYDSPSDWGRAKMFEGNGWN